MPREFISNEQEVRKTEKISEAEEKVFKLLVLKHKAGAIRIEDFKNVRGYSKESIEQDILSVQSKKTRIKEQGTEPSKRAQVLEALLAEQIELSDWFGPNTMTIIPSDYDDLYNGVDTAIEFQNKNNEFEYLATGIDITSSSKTIEKKLAMIRRHIEQGDLTQIKYFASERNPYKGPMEKIPQLVIGAESEIIQEISELWLTINQGRLASKEGLSEESLKLQKEKIREAKKKLAEHRIQVMLLEQIESQLVVFIEFAKKKNKTEIAQKYQALLELVQEILKDKEISEDDAEKNAWDTMNGWLNEVLLRFEVLDTEF